MECPICRKELDDSIMVTNCLHQFCSSCLLTWLSQPRDNYCPMCRGRICLLLYKVENQIHYVICLNYALSGLQMVEALEEALPRLKQYSRENEFFKDCKRN